MKRNQLSKNGLSKTILIIQGNVVGVRMLEIPIGRIPNAVGCLLPAHSGKNEMRYGRIRTFTFTIPGDQSPNDGLEPPYGFAQANSPPMRTASSVSPRNA